MENGTALVNGSRIVAVGEARDVKVAEGAEVHTFGYPGQTVMPGMIDCHPHHNGFGDGRSGEDVAALPDEILKSRAARNAKDSLFSGVTTIRAPRMMLCGRPIAIVGVHMGYFGFEATGEVRQLIKEGADYIKICATGGTTPTFFPLTAEVAIKQVVCRHSPTGVSSFLVRVEINPEGNGEAAELSG